MHPRDTKSLEPDEKLSRQDRKFHGEDQNLSQGHGKFHEEEAIFVPRDGSSHGREGSSPAIKIATKARRHKGTPREEKL